MVMNVGLVLNVEINYILAVVILIFGAIDVTFVYGREHLDNIGDKDG